MQRIGRHVVEDRPTQRREGVGEQLAPVPGVNGHQRQCGRHR
ncbi:hypothetical protein [Actinokineospora sp. HUAS TT18]